MATNTSFLSLSKPAYSENVSLSVINSNMDKIDAAVGQRSRVINLLDNSCFLPQFVVNQRGAESATGNKYSIDRWKGLTSASIHGITSEGLVITHGGTSGNAGVSQTLPDELANAIKNQTVTVAVCMADGSVYARSGIPANGTVSAYFASCSVQLYTNADTGALLLRIMHSNVGGSITVRWVALYEGEYTAETLPAYQPKGYAAELAECKRYYRKYTNFMIAGCSNGTTEFSGALDMFDMRIVPSVAAFKCSWLRVGGVYKAGTGVTAGIPTNGRINLTTSETIPENEGGAALVVNLELSADL